MATFSTLGSEFKVNSTTAGLQFSSSVAGLSGGGFVVVYSTTSGSGNKLLGQIYDAAGATVGGELTISNVGSSNAAEVTGLGSGFVVAYEAPNAPLFHPNSVWTEVFSGTGVGSGAVEAETGNNQGHAAMIAASTAGGFLTVWDETGIGPDTDQSAIRGGVSGGNGLTVNTTTAGHQAGPSIAALLDGSGNYVAAWTENDGVGSNEMKGQILSAAGAKIGGEFTIDNTVQSPSNLDMEIAGRPGAGYALAYSDNFATQVKVFGAGNALLADFSANDPAIDEGGDESAIAVLSNGLLAVTFRHFGSGAFSILKVFAPDGTQIGGRIDLQAGSGSGIITDPSIAALANGQFVVTWTDNRATLGDPDHGISGRRFTTSAAAVIDGTAANDAFNGAAQTGFFMGYGGTDSVTYVTAGAGVTIDLASPNLNTGAAAGDEFGNSIESIIGSNFADTMTGDLRDNALFGGAGDDILNGGAGDDGIPSAGDDRLDGGAGNDTVTYVGAFGAVTVNLAVLTAQNTGGAGTDTLSGFENVLGSSFGDTLIGDGAANVLDGAAGADSLTGGFGNDTYGVDNASDSVTELFGQGYDTINTTLLTYTLGANVERVNFVGAGNFVGTGNNLANRFQGGAGDDRFVDVLGGADIFSGNSGTDTVDFRASATGAILNFIINTHGGAAAGDSYSGIEKFLGSNTAGDTMTAGGVGRVIYAGFGGADTLTGGVKNDQLIGQGGNDTLSGGADRDSLEGGTGNDMLTGGTQGDVFVFIDAAFGQDTISDFEDGLDSFKVFSAVADNINDFTIANNGSTSVTLTLITAPANFITVNGVAPITITADDFVFY